jgi:hypothetical protein
MQEPPQDDSRVDDVPLEFRSSASRMTRRSVGLVYPYLNRARALNLLALELDTKETTGSHGLLSPCLQLPLSDRLLKSKPADSLQSILSSNTSSPTLSTISRP